MLRWHWSRIYADFQQKLFSSEHNTARRILLVTFLEEQKRDYDTRDNHLWHIASNFFVNVHSISLSGCTRNVAIQCVTSKINLLLYQFMGLLCFFWCPDNCPRENLPPGFLPPRTIAPKENCPPDNCPRGILPTRWLPVDYCSRIITQR